MGCTTRVTFLRDRRAQDHQLKLAAVEALRAAGIGQLPAELASYFKTKFADEVEEDSALEIAYVGSIGNGSLNNLPEYVTECEYVHGEPSDGVLIDVGKLPMGVSLIKVEHSC